MNKSTRFYQSKDYKKISGKPTIVRCVFQQGLTKFDQLVKKEAKQA